MLGGIYHLVVIAVAVWGIVTGFRKGLLRQMSAILGVAFGIVGARVGAPECTGYIDGWLPPTVSGFKRHFLTETLACGGIYILVSLLIGACMNPIAKLIGVIPAGILNSISGAVFRLFQFLMIVSIVYNLIVDMNPSGQLTRSSRHHDGNVVEVVMKIAPAVLGFPDGEEVGYRQQLEDAKKIS